MTVAVKQTGTSDQNAGKLSQNESPLPAAHQVDIEAMGKAARKASRTLAGLSSTRKNEALHAIADALEGRSAEVLAQNELDIADGRANGLSDALLDRLLLTPERMRGLAEDTRKVAALPDPVGAELESRLLPNGLRLSRRRIPIGVLGVIYEARPNTTIDIAVLSLKTGNAVILRGGKETLRSNLALVSVIAGALQAQGLPSDAIQYIGNPDRALVSQFLRMDEYVDLLIPRGGNSLHRLCREQSTIPVITGGIGICHYYIDISADQERGMDVIVNARTQRPSVCNALDTLLVNRQIAPEFLPKLAHRMAECGVEIRATPDAMPHLTDSGATVILAGPDDWDTEWMTLILGVKLVDSLDEAIAHIQEHSQDHSDGILTQDWNNAQRFVDAVNSSAVFVNASTRFNDGGEFGLGAEVAISTQKLHARGPMGLEELTTYKWIVLGDMHVRE
ncbi:MAG: glutamate-5-semialdehyde dehydrogenase [Caldilineaceae bacterium SB0670_bin_27]|uniref:Gamma-glutamyl phosphate reductase n=1 Tax=Caldilineaceae bacterium SB0664_bin_27 TaxID=2605260 RepID=A0A6B0YYK9_9CHLR|nr:glutamate-5-semialdehyde dehydrogenase [Caldilineaceae bacterium SB0664_bin_27]MYJ80195.1 glutamate-5-semialdehyde dehydrogenase [Caldilineaceae bacterium SB0670_bin_27]